MLSVFILCFVGVSIIIFIKNVTNTIEQQRLIREKLEYRRVADIVRENVVTEIEKSSLTSFERTNYPTPKEEKVFEEVYHQPVEEFRSSYRDYFTKTRKTIETNKKKTYYGKQHIECKYCNSWNIIDEFVGVCRCKSCGAGLKL